MQIAELTAQLSGDSAETIALREENEQLHAALRVLAGDHELDLVASATTASRVKQFLMQVIEQMDARLRHAELAKNEVLHACTEVMALAAQQAAQAASSLGAKPTEKDLEGFEALLYVLAKSVRLAKTQPLLAIEVPKGLGTPLELRASLPVDTHAAACAGRRCVGVRGGCPVGERIAHLEHQLETAVVALEQGLTVWPELEDWRWKMRGLLQGMAADDIDVGALGVAGVVGGSDAPHHQGAAADVSAAAVISGVVACGGGDSGGTANGRDGEGFEGLAGVARRLPMTVAPSAVVAADEPNGIGGIGQLTPLRGSLSGADCTPLSEPSTGGRRRSTSTASVDIGYEAME